MTDGPEPRRVVAITGAGGALGAAVSRRLAGEPATDLVLSDVSEPSLDATVAGLPEARGAIETALADVGDVDQVRSVIELAVERFGRLDVLISNAGVLSPNGRIHNLTTEDWERAFRVNVLGAVNGIRVNCVCPGTFRSAIHDELPPEALDAIEGRHPLGLGAADDLVGAYSYLAGDGSRWTTGSALVVDGGYSAP